MSIRVSTRAISGNVSVTCIVIGQRWCIESASIFVWHIVVSKYGVTIVHWIGLSFLNTILINSKILSIIFFCMIFTSNFYDGTKII